VIDGQKVWTSLAHWAQWCFVLARTDRDAPRHRGISYLLVPMDQPGIEIRPIVQITGTSEFNEVFFDGARTKADLVVGDVNGGWKVAMGTLAFERGALTLGQQLGFVQEWHEIVAAATERGITGDRVTRQRLAQAWIELEIMRYTAMRGLTALGRGDVTRETSIGKLFWAQLHRRMGELAMDVLGPWSEIAEGARYELTRAQAMFLYTRADTIYGGSNQIQRNIIGERVLGLPPEPKVV
jgi:alkylation response protein AidB-like acyl-CoA dehydrogenase